MKLTAFIIALGVSLGTFAQTTSSTDTAAMITSASATNVLPPKPYFHNIVKMNLSSLYLKNYNFSYERLITRKTSVIASFRSMPQTNLGTLKLVEKLVRITEEESIREDLSLITASNKTFTAEIRFYGGRKPGAKGFYLGLYGRTAAFNAHYNYPYSSGSKDYDIPLQIEARGIGGGFVTGWQFAIARRVTVDLYLLGAHYGKLKGDVTGTVNLSSMTAGEQQQLQDELNDLLVVRNSSYLNTTVNNSGIKGKVSGPFAGLRGLGLHVGIAF